MVLKNFDRFRKDLTVLSGFYNATYTFRGDVRLEPKSLSFGANVRRGVRPRLSRNPQCDLGRVMQHKGFRSQEEVDAMVEKPWGTNDAAIADQPASRANDPVTSHVAASMASEWLSATGEIIFEALISLREATIDELAKVTRLTSVQIARRLPEMKEDCRAETTGETRPSLAGRPQRVWRLKHG